MESRPATHQKSLLMIAYYFPPSGGPGSIRVAKFAKYLPTNGWLPTVVSSAAMWPPIDASLIDEIPPDVSVERVHGAELPPRVPWRLRSFLSKWILTIDERLGWLPFARGHAIRMLRLGKYDALYSTSSPITDHLVALCLKSRSGLPWIADFRDPWLDNFSVSFPTSVHRSICAHYEKRIVSSADKVVVVNEPMREQFKSRYPDVGDSKFVVVPNGYDPADFHGVTPAHRDKRFTMVYCGSLYGSQQRADSFLLALREAISGRKLPRDEIVVRFVGSVGRETINFVERLGIADTVEFVGVVTHSEAIAHQLSADCLILIIGDGPGSEAVTTSKLFEYLASKKPILALVPPGAAANLLTEASSAEIVPPGDEIAISKALQDLFSTWKGGGLRIEPRQTVLSRYSRKEHSRQLASLLDGLCSPGHP